MSNRFIFTSESVSEGHPDKICDQISDAILDTHLSKDKFSRVACECLVTTGQVFVGGEITSQYSPNYVELIRNVLKDIGYTREGIGFSAEGSSVLSAIHSQSPDISQGVNEKDGLHSGQGAGDQGIMFGYACNETQEYMPATLMFSHKLLKQLAKVRKSNQIDWILPDSKSQVTIEYENDKPKRIHAIVISTQHTEDITQKDIKDYMIKNIIPQVIPSHLLDDDVIYHVNPTGKFVIGGPHGDCGLTGRKIIVDTYGGWGAHGGGAFSGKDPSKVDRSAAYMARYISKNIVAAGIAEKFLLQLSYAIGVPYPISINVNTYGTSKYNNEEIVKVINNVFDCRPQAIIENLDLLRPIYQQTAAYGHFGRSDIDLPWEKLDKIDEIKSQF